VPSVLFRVMFGKNVFSPVEELRLYPESLGRQAVLEIRDQIYGSLCSLSLLLSAALNFLTRTALIRILTDPCNLRAIQSGSSRDAALKSACCPILLLFWYLWSNL
jgi:hypothetical protein